METDRSNGGQVDVLLTTLENQAGVIDPSEQARIVEMLAVAEEYGLLEAAAVAGASGGAAGNTRVYNVGKISVMHGF